MAKLLDQARQLMRTRHYSLRTEESYVRWMKEYIVFHGKRHPATLGAAEVSAFLSYLATNRNVAAAIQQQATAAIIFLYRDLLNIELSWLNHIERANLNLVCLEVKAVKIFACANGDVACCI